MHLLVIFRVCIPNALNGKAKFLFSSLEGKTYIHFAYPEEFVDFQKQNYLRSAAEAFLESNPGHIKVQFDVISIHLGGETVKEIVHFEDAF